MSVGSCTDCGAGDHHKCDGNCDNGDECACVYVMEPPAAAPRDALEVIRDALVVDVADSEPLHISDVYTHTGQAIVILDALAAAGYDLRYLGSTS